MGFRFYNDYYNYIVSIKLSGQIGHSYVYYLIKNVQYRRKYFIPPDPKTDAQLRIRDLMRKSVQKWHSLTPQEQTLHNVVPHYDPTMSGYNFFISCYIKAYR